MSFAVKVLPLAIAAAALVSACSDASSPTQAFPAPGAPLASKGGSGGSSGGGGGGGGAPFVITTPPAVNATGTWTGTTDGPDVVHNYTYTLTQTSNGIVSGSGLVTTPFTTVSYLVAGTVNGDTLMLYSGMVCSGCTLNPLYRGIISSSGARVDGSFLSGGVSPLTLFKQ